MSDSSSCWTPQSEMLLYVKFSLTFSGLSSPSGTLAKRSIWVKESELNRWLAELRRKREKRMKKTFLSLPLSLHLLPSGFRFSAVWLPPRRQLWLSASVWLPPGLLLSSVWLPLLLRFSLFSHFLLVYSSHFLPSCFYGVLAFPLSDFSFLMYFLLSGF